MASAPRTSGVHPRAWQKGNLYSPKMNTLQRQISLVVFFFFHRFIYLLRYLKLEHEEGALFTDVKLEGGHS
jgi:hypothetical protein